MTEQMAVLYSLNWEGIDGAYLSLSYTSLVEAHEAAEKLARADFDVQIWRHEKQLIDTVPATRRSSTY